MSRVINIVMLLTVMIIGIPCNIFAIHFIYKEILKKSTRSVKDKVVGVLCMCNLCLVLAYGIELHSAINYQQISDGSCKVAAFIICFMTFNSIGYFVALIMERYLRIIYPYKAERVVRMKSFSVLCITVPIIFGFSLALFPLVGWGNFGRSRENSTYCGYDFQDEKMGSYLVAAMGFSFCLPLCLSGICYAHIVIELRRTTEAMTRKFGRNSVIRRMSSRSLHEQYISSMLTALIYIVSWCPYGVVCILFFYNSHVSINVEYFSIYMSKSCIITSPIIFCLIEKRVRRYIKKEIVTTNKQILFRMERLAGIRESNVRESEALF